MGTATVPYMPIPRQKFVEEVWKALGAEGKTDFARKLGLGPDGLQKVRRWQSGGRLDYEDVMVMLERTGWFVIDGHVPLTQSLSGRPEAIAGSLVDVTRALNQILDRLDKMQAGIEARPAPSQVRPKRKGSA